MADIEQYSDLELVALIHSDDTTGLDELFRRYAHRLCDFAFQYVNDLEIAKELVSDLFLRLWMKRHQLVISSHVKSYLFTAVRNNCLNHLRTEQQHFEDLSTLENTSQGPHMEADQTLKAAEATLLVEHILKDLPPQRKRVFRMHRLEGMTYKEIAEILGLSENTVHRHMVAAIKQLAKAYPDWKSWMTLLALLIGLGVIFI